MRDSSQIMDIVLTSAKEEPDIRAVFQTGSRVNPNVKRDIYQDYDIIYCVKDPEIFINREDFLEKFGERIFTYFLGPEKEEVGGASFVWTLLLVDGVRIDLSFYPISKISSLIIENTLINLLMDKDNIIKELPISSDISYRIDRPTKNIFENKCREFFYYSLDIVPYLIRGDMVGSYKVYQHIISTLNIVLGWLIAEEKEYKINLGKNNRFILENIEENFKKAYLRLYQAVDRESYFVALLEALALFRKFGLTLAERLGYNYPKNLDVSMTRYIREAYQKKDQRRIY